MESALQESGADRSAVFILGDRARRPWRAAGMVPALKVRWLDGGAGGEARWRRRIPAGSRLSSSASAKNPPPSSSNRSRMMVPPASS